MPPRAKKGGRGGSSSHEAGASSTPRTTRSSTAARNNERKSNPDGKYKTSGALFQAISAVMDNWGPEKLTLPNIMYGSKEWLQEMKNQIVEDILMGDDFELYTDGKPIGARTVRNMTMIAHRFMICNSPLVRCTLNRHREGLFETQGFVLEVTLGADRLEGRSKQSKSPRRAEALAKGSSGCPALNFKRIETRIPCYQDWNYIFTEGSQRVSKNPRNAEYYQYGYDNDCRGLLQSVIFHTAGVFSMALARLSVNDISDTRLHAGKIFESVVPSYDQSAPTRDLVSHVSYECNLESFVDFKDNYWIGIVNEVLQVAKAFFERFVSALPEDRRVRAGRATTPTGIKADKLYLSEADQERITVLELLRHFFSIDESPVEFWANVISDLFEVVLRNDRALYTEILEVARFNAVYNNGCRQILKTLYDLILTTASDCAVQFGLQEGSPREDYHPNFQQWQDAVMESVRNRPVRHIEAPEVNNRLAAERNGLVISEVQVPSQSVPVVEELNEVGNNQVQLKFPVEGSTISQINDSTLDTNPGDLSEAVSSHQRDRNAREHGIGTVNNSGVESFSTLHQGANENEDGEHGFEDARKEESEPSGNYEVEGVDCLSSKFSAVYLLTKWAKEKSLMLPRMEDTLLWAAKNITCTSGPLEGYGRNDRHNQTISQFSSRDEFIGNFCLLTAVELYDSILSVFENQQLWRIQVPDIRRRSVPYDGDVVIADLATIRVSMGMRGREVFTAYSLLVVHVFVQEITPDGRRLLRPYRRQLMFADSVEVNPHNNEEEVIHGFVLATSQLLPAESETDAFILAERQRAGREGREANIPLFINLAVGKYVGPTVKYWVYLSHMDSMNQRIVSLVLGKRQLQDEFHRIPPFNDQENVTAAEVQQRVEDSNLTQSSFRFMQLLTRAENPVLPEQENRQHQYISTRNMPQAPVPGQVEAIISTLEIVFENRKETEQKSVPSPFFCIVGPAGTGKTTTAINIVSTFLSDPIVSKSICQIFDHIENHKDPTYLGPDDRTLGPAPEDKKRILFVTPSNSALNQIENKLYDGILISPEAGKVRMLTPLYTKVAMPHERKRRNDNESQQRYEVPELYRRHYTGVITLSTFGSLPRAFSGECLNQHRKRNRLPQYDIIIVDEGSQVDLRMFLTVVQHAWDEVCSDGIKPTIVIVGDPYQQQPVTQGAPSKFTDLAGRNVIDYLIRERHSGNQFRQPLCYWLMLNTQFRMTPLISRLSNAITDRVVFNHNCTRHPQRRNVNVPFQYVERITHNFEPPHDRPISRFTNNQNLSFSITAVDPYPNTRPIVSFAQPPRIIRFTSFTEAACVTRIAEYLMERTNYEPADVVILSPYGNQVGLIKDLLRTRHEERLVEARDRNEAGDNIKNLNLVDCMTVAAIQSDERRCVIFSTVRHAREQQSGRRRTLGIAGYPETVYVAVSRARDQLIFVGDMRYLSRFNTWDTVTSFLEGNDFRYHEDHRYINNVISGALPFPQS